MAVEVHFSDDQHDGAPDLPALQGLAEGAVAAMVTGDVELAVRFVDEATIAELNEGYLGHLGPTDVLSFPIEEAPLEAVATDGPPLLLGDVVICPAVAARNAPTHAGTTEDELALLLVHGILHLFGLDHEDDDEAEEMEAKERELLAAHFHPSAAT